MHFLKRSLSFTRFKVIGKFSFARENYQNMLSRNQFRNLSELEDQDESVGWVSPENCLQPPELDFMLSEPYFKLMMRLDKRKIPAALLSGHIAIEEKAALEGAGKQKLSLKERREIRLSVKKFLLENASPSSSIYKALWNFKTRDCFLLSTSKGIQNRFSKLFEDTFELELALQTPWAMAHSWAQDNNITSKLENLEACTFLE